ncbi:hypothetical protein V6N12_003320 [Hibiscus sabdariffa]|uniref:Uncharacterized protein n=1 Tax=Hibiscus sabdariffa TaxID=183260 RepID=A0ABR2EDA7_9ROSI
MSLQFQPSFSRSKICTFFIFPAHNTKILKQFTLKLESYDLSAKGNIGRQESALPIPSLELGHGILAKAFISWLLEWKAQREAGFTEQRQLPALGSGRITGRCLLGFIMAPLVDPQLDLLSFFLKLFL